MLECFNIKPTLERAKRYGIDPRDIDPREIPRIDFKGECLNFQQSLAIAIEREISQYLAARHPYKPTTHIRVNRED